MPSRRLPVYIALDTSGSMRGELIQAVNVGLQSMLVSLRQNPFALESVHLSIVTFDSKVNEVLPLTPLDSVSIPEIVCPESGPTFLGEALFYFFKYGSRNNDMLGIKGREKEGKWFASPSNRSKFLDPRELGDWMLQLKVCLMIARAVRRMHAAGLAHSDLSYKRADRSHYRPCLRHRYRRLGRAGQVSAGRSGHTGLHCPRVRDDRQLEQG